MRRWITTSASWMVGTSALVCVLADAAASQTTDPHKLLVEADRLAWLRVWTRAEPLYAEARKSFAAAGDRRSALYAEVCQLRGKLPTLSVPEVSERLTVYLLDPTVRSDERLRLRVLVIKGETDEDLDPALSQRSWTEALALAEKLGDAGWANRARAELGLVAFLQGDTNTAIVNLGQAIKVAESTRDVSSLVRWLTLFGHGYVELGRPEQALDFYDRALKVAATIPELQLPVMTYLGKADALVRLGRTGEAEGLIASALEAAKAEGSFGYQAELTLRQGLIAARQRKTDVALAAMAKASDLARSAGGNRILAGVALERARLLRTAGGSTEAERTLRDGISASRKMGERLLLPRLLAQLADVRLAAGASVEAGNLLREADDILEGLLTNASSPWVRARLLSSMDAVLSARISLEGQRAAREPTRLFNVVERARGRSLLDLLYARPLATLKKSAEFEGGERRVANLQLRLLRTTGPADRQRLLDEIFAAEEGLAPMATELFTRSRQRLRSTVSLSAVQAALRRDEVLVEFALSEPASFALVITTDGARTVRLAGRTAIGKQAMALVTPARNGADDVASAAQALSRSLLSGINELDTHRRLIVSADGSLQQVPFELLPFGAQRRLLDSHVVSYTQSASVLTMLRSRTAVGLAPRVALAVGASPTGVPASGARVTRDVYDLDLSKLSPLPLATDEARAVGAAFGTGESLVVVDEAATEARLKAEPLADFRVLHLAAHGIVSTKMPARSAVMLRASDGEDGLLQAREILELQLNSALVTLSACDTGTGADHGQDGVASLVRPFIAAGARSVVANLWAVDDTSSSALMREFYRELASGVDIGESLRRAKLALMAKFGPAATPQLWGGVLAYGDASQVVVRRATQTATRR